MIEMDRAKIESIIRENGYDDFKWISGKDVVVPPVARFRCMCGCSSYGKKG
jgi:predicted metal-binding protein